MSFCLWWPSWWSLSFSSYFHRSSSGDSQHLFWNYGCSLFGLKLCPSNVQTIRDVLYIINTDPSGKNINVLQRFCHTVFHIMGAKWLWFKKFKQTKNSIKIPYCLQKWGHLLNQKNNHYKKFHEAKLRPDQICLFWCYSTPMRWDDTHTSGFFGGIGCVLSRGGSDLAYQIHELELCWIFSEFIKSITFMLITINLLPVIIFILPLTGGKKSFNSI